jgi:lysophospholipase L1-like esterase
MPYMSVTGLLAGYAAYNQVIREVATESDALLIDDAVSIPADATHFSDSFHFRDAGSALMAQRVLQALLYSETFQDLIRAKTGS